MSPASQPPRRRTWILRALALVVWVLVVLVGIDFFLYRRFVEPLRRKQPPQWLAAVQGRLPPELMRKVGYFSNSKRSSFLRFPTEKPAGVTRLCAFGDSFTHGDEVEDANDYPSLLKSVLETHAPGRYEVLNFGNSSYGFHQSFVLWDAFAKRYACDRVLLGPATFFADRDTSFNHVGLSNPYYLHARYVLDGDGVRLVEVPGLTLEERTDEYLRFVPHLDYARFDRAPPAFLRAALRDGQTIANPFYYRSDDATAEAIETYRRLLRTIIASGSPMLVATSGEFAEMMHGLGPGAPQTFAPVVPSTFPYRAPRNHHGPIGNQLLARQYAAELEPSAPQRFSVLRTEALPLPELPPDAVRAPALAKYARAYAAIGRVPVGHFVSGTEVSKRKGAPELLATAGIVSLVQVGGPRPSELSGGSIAEGCFAPLDQPLAGSPEVCLRITRGGGTSTRCVGRIARLAAGVNVGTLVLDGVSIEDRPVLQEENHLILTAQAPEIAELLRGASAVAVEANGVTLLDGPARGDGFLLSPGKRGCFRLRANETGLADVETLGATGVVELVLEPPRGAATRVPLAAWRKVEVPLSG